MKRIFFCSEGGVELKKIKKDPLISKSYYKKKLDYYTFSDETVITVKLKKKTKKDK